MSPFRLALLFWVLFFSIVDSRNVLYFLSYFASNGAFRLDELCWPLAAAADAPRGKWILALND